MFITINTQTASKFSLFLCILTYTFYCRYDI